MCHQWLCLHWLASVRFAGVNITYFSEGPSEPKQVASGDISSSKALIGSQGFFKKGESNSPRKSCNSKTSWFVWKNGEGTFCRKQTTDKWELG